jgi:hypothetical protein
VVRALMQLSARRFLAPIWMIYVTTKMRSKQEARISLARWRATRTGRSEARSAAKRPPPQQQEAMLQVSGV